MTTQLRFRTRHQATNAASVKAKRVAREITVALLSFSFATLPAIADTSQSEGASAAPTPEQVHTLSSQIDAIDVQIVAQLKSMQDELDRVRRTLADEARTLDEIRTEVRSFSAERSSDEG